MPALLSWYASPAALIGAEVVPFRPHRGVLLIVEEPTGSDTAAWLRWLHTDHYPAVLATPGTAGVWMYGSTNTWKLHPATQGDPQYITVIYLDDDPLVISEVLAPLLQERWTFGRGATVVRGTAANDDPVGGMELTLNHVSTLLTEASASM